MKFESKTFEFHDDETTSSLPPLDDGSIPEPEWMRPHRSRHAQPLDQGRPRENRRGAAPADRAQSPLATFDAKLAKAARVHLASPGR
jgi:hypothetical protein